MQRKISARDWELLSEYVDGALSPRAQARLEARLGENQNLADQFRRLEHTRALLKKAPQAQPPRHFALSPEMVKGRSGLFGAPNLSLSALSAIASVLLLVVLMGEVLTFGLPVPASGSTARSVEIAEEPLAMMAPAAAADAAESAADTAMLEQSELQADDSFVEEGNQFDQAAAEAQPNISIESASAKETSATTGFAITRQTLRLTEIFLALLALGIMLMAKRPKG